MSVDVITEQETGGIETILPPFPKRWWGKLLYGLYVVVLPILAFGSMDLVKPKWRSGGLSNYRDFLRNRFHHEEIIYKRKT